MSDAPKTPRTKLLDVVDDPSLLEQQSVIPTGDLKAVIELAEAYCVKTDTERYRGLDTEELLWKAGLYVKEVGENGS